MKRAGLRSLGLLAVGVAGCLCASTARAAEWRAHLVATYAERPPGPGPVQARLGELVRLQLVLERGSGRQGRLYAAASRLRLVPGGPLRRALPLEELGPLRISWYRVEPELHHLALRPPNEGNPAYSNSVLFGPRHGVWLGYDRLEYRRTLIAGARGAVLEVRRAAPSHAKLAAHGGLGTMRFQAVVLIAGSEVSSPGLEAQERGGLSPAVMRVSFRAGDDLPGHLTSYFNVPNVFGSAGVAASKHQTELYQGADCADVIVGAARRAGARVPYTSALGLKAYSRPVTPRLLLKEDGLFLADGPRKGERVRLRFGEEVRPGDLMLIDYYGFNGSPRSWDHVGVLAEDRGRKGELDPEDQLLHMGYLHGLVKAALSTEGPAYVQFLRFRPSIERAWRAGSR
ncbi:MAG: hypothetical protein IT371_00675 [Deltaproteobacteria bacterium]|nr:hypothetical protein [Deltaproteobacteria bacterium]